MYSFNHDYLLFENPHTSSHSGACPRGIRTVVVVVLFWNPRIHMKRWIRCLLSRIRCPLSWFRCLLSWIRCPQSWIRCLLAWIGSLRLWLSGASFLAVEVDLDGDFLGERRLEADVERHSALEHLVFGRLQGGAKCLINWTKLVQCFQGLTLPSCAYPLPGLLARLGKAGRLGEF
jgi:hypothetical protein